MMSNVLFLSCLKGNQKSTSEHQHSRRVLVFLLIALFCVSMSVNLLSKDEIMATLYYNVS